MDLGCVSGASRAACARSLAVVSAALLLAAAPGVVAATDLRFVPLSPSFGGSTTIALQMEQLQRSLETARDARRAAEARAAAAPTSSQTFANSIISQLNGLVARNIANQIVNSSPGESGTIASGDVAVTFVNQDGQLTVVIATPSGTTNLTVPSGN